MRRDQLRQDDGFALMAVVMGVGAIIFLVVVLLQNALQAYDSAQHQRRDDTLVAGAEAMLERYAAKMTIDPMYYRNRVDEAELPRECTDQRSLHFRAVVEPGNAWYPDCTTWSYPLSAEEYFRHPLLAGRADIDADDIEALLTVTPPLSGEAGITLTVAVRESEFTQARAVTAEVRPEAISEFAFLVEGSLRFGSGANITGKIYVGNDLDFAQAPVKGVVHRNIFAEDAIGRTSGYGPPTFADGSRGYDGRGDYLDIRTIYPDPLDFTSFWDDLDLIRQVACGGGGLCLSRTANPGLGLSQTPTAWLLEPTVSGDAGRITVSAAYTSTTTSCLTAEEWWWVNSQSASWVTVGTFDVPANGVVWVDGHAVIGRSPGNASMIRIPMTIYAGTVGSPKNIIIGGDIRYHSGRNGTTVLGLIASDELYVNPHGVGNDNKMEINAAILAQNGNFNVARDCGDSGSPLLPYSGGVPISTLDFWGSMAKRSTGDVAAHFGTRNYNFDSRLEGLRPPLFPLFGDSWSYGNWQEIHLPCWATSAGCG